MEGFIEFPSQQIWAKLELLKTDTKALWGIMTPQHMVEHLMLPLQFSRKVFEVPLVTPAEKVDRIKQLMLLGPHPLKKEFPAPFLGEGLQELKFNSLEAAIDGLKAEVELFLEFWENNPTEKVCHPIFGYLNREEWLVFQSKHFTHHYTQFGLL